MSMLDVTKLGRKAYVIVRPQPTSKEIDYLLTRGVALVEKEADLRRLLLEGNKGRATTCKTWRRSDALRANNRPCRRFP